jgi:hypothetical protein
VDARVDDAATGQMDRPGDAVEQAGMVSGQHGDQRGPALGIVLRLTESGSPSALSICWRLSAMMSGSAIQ